MRIDPSIVSGYRERRRTSLREPLIRAAIAKAGGQLRELDLTGRILKPQTLLEAFASNANSYTISIYVHTSRVAGDRGGRTVCSLQLIGMFATHQVLPERAKARCSTARGARYRWYARRRGRVWGLAPVFVRGTATLADSTDIGSFQNAQKHGVLLREWLDIGGALAGAEVTWPYLAPSRLTGASPVRV